MDNSIKIAFILGTRAQIIKTAPLMKLMEEKNLSYRFVYTAQHRITIANLLRNFGLRDPDYTVVKWEREAKTIRLFLGSWLVRMIFALLFQRKRVLPFRKGVIITHGDTATTLWGALLGKLTGNKVMHLESGLRSFNLFNPFPEELNRIITFYLSNIYVCPNSWAANNVRRFKGVKLNMGGNTQMDTLKIALHNIDAVELNIPTLKYFVASIHRYEHIFKKRTLFKVVDIIKVLSEKYRCIFVLHPATEKQLIKYRLINELKKENIEFYPRLDFFRFIKLIYHSEFVVTDGGSNQEELSYMGKPTLILRKYTERLEGLGQNAVLSKLNRNKVENFVNDYENYKRPVQNNTVSPSKRVLEWLEAKIIQPQAIR